MGSSDVYLILAFLNSICHIVRGHTVNAKTMFDLRKKEGASFMRPLQPELFSSGRRKCCLGDLRLLHFLNQWWHDIKQIANHGNVGDLEDRRFRIFIDRNDSARTFHPHYVLNRATDP
jgi:hypothetical protein